MGNIQMLNQFDNIIKQQILNDFSGVQLTRKVVRNLHKYLQQHVNVQTYINQFVADNPIYVSNINVLFLILSNKDLKQCPGCGKYLSYERTIKGFTFCNNQCKKDHKDLIVSKRQKTCINSYGVSNVMNVKGVVDKQHKTMIDRYGVNSPLQNQTIKSKQQQTCLQRYDAINVSHNQQIKDKKKATSLQHYGVEHPTQNSSIKEKQKQTSIQNNGVEYVFATDQIKEKIKNNNIIKYGVPFNLQRKDIQSKLIIDRLKKSYQRIKTFEQHQIKPLFTEDEYLTKGYNGIYQWKCMKCSNIFYQKLYSTQHNKNILDLPRCLNCYPFDEDVGTSLKEQQLKKFIHDVYCSIIVENDKQLIKPYELDIIIPEKKIAIEFDGLYWHSDAIERINSNYHVMKTDMCEQQGYQLIHIFENDWDNKQNIIKNKIKAILGIEQKTIYARKCVIKEIDNKTKNKFLNNNHIQGEDKSKIKLGLYFKNLLVAVMTFGKPRFNKNYQYELIRYASLSGYRVIGGAGKLLKYFERKYNPESIITYADRRYSKGNMYFKLGFNFIGNSEPSYYWTNCSSVLSRYQCQKSKLKTILGDSFNSNLSETENMKLNGWNKIYDCGNMVFEKHCLET